MSGRYLGCNDVWQLCYCSQEYKQAETPQLAVDRARAGLPSGVKAYSLPWGIQDPIAHARRLHRGIQRTFCDIAFDRVQ